MSKRFNGHPYTPWWRSISTVGEWRKMDKEMSVFLAITHFIISTFHGILSNP